eukprot:gene7440-10136_t
MSDYSLPQEFPEKRKLSGDANYGEKKQATEAGRSNSSVMDQKSDPNSSQQTITVQMPCPQTKVATLIGKKGVVIHEIMKRSGCRIFVDQNFPEGHPRQIHLTGVPSALSVAMQLATQVIAEGADFICPQHNEYSGPEDKEHQIVDSDFTCSHAKVGTVIGYKGSNVNEIYKRTGCRVQVLQDGLPDGVDRKLTFTGAPSQIVAAKAIVTSLINEGVQSLGMSKTDLVGQNSNTQETDIQPEKVRVVIGAKGVTVTEIIKRSGARVVIDQNFPPGVPHKVKYTGSPQQIEIAKYLVDLVISSGANALLNFGPHDVLTVQEVTLNQNHLTALLRSTNGISLVEIENMCGVKINFNLANTAVVVGQNGIMEATNKVSVIGKVENVNTAMKMIYQYSGGNMMPPVGAGGFGVNPMMGGINNMYFPNPSNPAGGYMPQNQSGYLPQNMHSSGMVPAQHTASYQQAPQAQTAVLALGEDGTSGQLESAISLPDGTHKQIADVKNDVAGKVVGKNHSNLTLIMSKSGASVQANKPDAFTIGMTRIVMIGMPHAVQLAAQMIQEILVNGTGKILAMPDVPSTVPMGQMPAIGGYYGGPTATGLPSIQTPQNYQQFNPAQYNQQNAYMPQQQYQQQLYGAQAKRL